MKLDARKKIDQPIHKPGRTTLQWIPEGVAGTKATLAIMCRIVRQYKAIPEIRQLALDIVKNCPGKAWVCEISAIRNWVRSNIVYRKDINGIETIHTPDQILKIRQGDCDDQSVLVASLLESIGHPTRFTAISFQPNEFVHVFTETKIGGKKWVSVETTEPVDLGWQPPNVYQRLIYYS